MICLFENNPFVSDITIKRLHSDVFVHLLFTLLMVRIPSVGYGNGQTTDYLHWVDETDSRL